MKKVKFIKEFVSASLGNVWIGRTIEMTKENAEYWLKNGYAEEIGVVKEKEDGDSNIDGNQEPPANRPKRRGRPSANLS